MSVAEQLASSTASVEIQSNATLAEQEGGRNVGRWLRGSRGQAPPQDIMRRTMSEIELEVDELSFVDAGRRAWSAPPASVNPFSSECFSGVQHARTSRASALCKQWTQQRKAIQAAEYDRLKRQIAAEAEAVENLIDGFMSWLRSDPDLAALIGLLDCAFGASSSPFLIPGTRPLHFKTQLLEAVINRLRFALSLKLGLKNGLSNTKLDAAQHAALASCIPRKPYTTTHHLMLCGLQCRIVVLMLVGACQDRENVMLLTAAGKNNVFRRLRQSLQDEAGELDVVALSDICHVLAALRQSLTGLLKQHDRKSRHNLRHLQFQIYQRAYHACDKFLFRGNVNATVDDMNRTIETYSRVAACRPREFANKLMTVLDEMLS